MFINWKVISSRIFERYEKKAPVIVPGGRLCKYRLSNINITVNDKFNINLWMTARRKTYTSVHIPKKYIETENNI